MANLTCSETKFYLPSSLLHLSRIGNWNRCKCKAVIYKCFINLHMSEYPEIISCRCNPSLNYTYCIQYAVQCHMGIFNLSPLYLITATSFSPSLLMISPSSHPQPISSSLKSSLAIPRLVVFSPLKSHIVVLPEGQWDSFHWLFNWCHGKAMF